MINPRYRDMFPGLGYAVVIFSSYCTLEFLYNRLSGKGGGHH